MALADGGGQRVELLQADVRLVFEVILIGQALRVDHTGPAAQAIEADQALKAHIHTVLGGAAGRLADNRALGTGLRFGAPREERGHEDERRQTLHVITLAAPGAGLHPKGGAA